MKGYKFKGRSWEKVQFNYSIYYRLLMKIHYYCYPFFTILFFTDKLFTLYYRFIGVKIGKGTIIRKGTFINDPKALIIGDNCSIHGEFKSRGRIIIGNNVEIVQDVLISTQSHNVNSEYFESKYSPVRIGNYCWIGPRACILQGCELEEGVVIGALSVVTKSIISPWTVAVGSPAVVKRPRVQLYIP